MSRKRGKTPVKSHSGGSDADDESVLPAKQPNRKRLSTVSFASTPHVQVSSSAPANRPSDGLSFVSKCSSYQSTDETFTPGSVGTVKSSVGSAGSSSTGESVIDPEEEVTITNVARQSQGESPPPYFFVALFSKIDWFFKLGCSELLTQCIAR